MVALIAVLVATAACGNDTGGGGSADVTVNDDGGSIDVAVNDAAADVATDVAADTAADAAKDTSADSAADSVADSATDTAADAVTDTAADTADDVAADVATDTTTDAGPACLKWAAGCVEANCEAIGAARSALYKQVEVDGAKACSAKTDCVIFDTNTACAGTCGTAVHKDTVPALTALFTSFDADVCKAFGAAGTCGYSTPSCMQPDPTCEAGVCVYAPTKPVGNCIDPQPAGTLCVDGNWACKPDYFKPWAKSDCLEATCPNMQAALSDVVNGVGDTAKACVVDDECVAISVSTACQGACPLAVNSGMQNDVLLAVGWFDEHVCKQFGYAEKCGYSTPKCMAPNVGCEAKSCVYSKGPP